MTDEQVSYTLTAHALEVDLDVQQLVFNTLHVIYGRGQQVEFISI